MNGSKMLQSCCRNLSGQGQVRPWSSALRTRRGGSLLPDLGQRGPIYGLAKGALSCPQAGSGIWFCKPALVTSARASACRRFCPLQVFRIYRRRDAIAAKTDIETDMDEGLIPLDNKSSLGVYCCPPQAPVVGTGKCRQVLTCDIRLM